ncbi:MAG: thymidine phosphorylase [Thermaerobacter sp.]|nr:thymidine phosphorylase [Thermaerobacter sp.]
MSRSLLPFIEKTRDGHPLTESELTALVTAVADGSASDYQLAAWLMAVTCRGLSDQEVYWLTAAMAQSGERETAPLGLVDKHSTGGVGDKTTLAVAPLVATLGIAVAKMSGRGLGHTGGTLDKLESIPGFRVNLTRDAMARQIAEVGVAVVAQTAELAPADKRMYALRDVTGTVDSIPLIAASVMSKKLASGAPNLVLDVKVGSGAFMKSLAAAQRLARLMVAIGRFHGRKVRALLTNMDQPLGYAVGNAIEVNEARQVLMGGGPGDLRHEVIELAAHMVSLVTGADVSKTRGQAEQALQDGAAMQTFQRWIVAQGGDPAALAGDLPLAPIREAWIAPASATVAAIDAQRIGEAALGLGAGRQQLGDPVDHAVGLRLYVKTGQQIQSGDTLAEVYARTPEAAAQALRVLANAVTWSDGDSRSAHESVVLDIIDSHPGAAGA